MHTSRAVNDNPAEVVMHSCDACVHAICLDATYAMEPHQVLMRPHQQLPQLLHCQLRMTAYVTSLVLSFRPRHGLHVDHVKGKACIRGGPGRLYGVVLVCVTHVAGFDRPVLDVGIARVLLLSIGVIQHRR